MVTSANASQVMRHQLKMYVQRQMANAMEVVGTDGANQVRDQGLGFRVSVVGTDCANQVRDQYQSLDTDP